MRSKLLHSVFLILMINCNQKPNENQVYQTRFKSLESYFFNVFGEPREHLLNSNFVLIDASYFQCAKYYLDLIREIDHPFLSKCALIISGDDNSIVLSNYIEEYKSKFRKVLVDKKALAKRYDLGLVHMTLFVTDGSSLVNITDLNDYSKNAILNLLTFHNNEL